MKETNVACRFCGQYIALGFEFEGNKVSEERAALLCDCDEARKYQKQMEMEAKEVARREETLQLSELRIHELFGREGEHDETHIPMSECILNHLQEVSVLVYDKKIGRATVDLPYGVKAAVSRNAKGYLKIKRQDKHDREIEI